MKKVIVTGGMGYIGSHTVVELIRKGYQVVIADNLCNSDISILEKIEKITASRPVFERVNLDCSSSAEAFFEEHKDANVVINFAALKAVGESVQKPIKYYRTNLNILLNVLENMERCSIQKLIFSSSATVYGHPDKLPITEESPLKRPSSPYGNTKKVSEEIIEDFVNISEKIQAVSLRYFNPIGAHEPALIGELPSGIPNNLVPSITQNAIGKRKKLIVFGDDYNTADGSCVRDFIHVVDLAKAHVATIDYINDKNEKGFYDMINIGTGKGNSVLELINTFEKVNGVRLEFEIGHRRPGDIEITYADVEKAKRVLNWKAEKTIEESLKDAWRWELVSYK